MPFQRPNYDWKTGKKIGATKDTIYSNMLFFSDGIFTREFQQLICNNCNTIEDKIRYLRGVENNKQAGADLFYNSFVWGIYKIEDGIIKTQSVNRQSWPNPYWYLVEIWYRITTENTIVQIYSKDLIENKKLSPNSDDTIPYNFIEANLILKSDTWLKNEKWFWCDEKAYEEYKAKNRIH